MFYINVHICNYACAKDLRCFARRLHITPEEKIHDYEQLINQMIFYGGQGVFFDKDTRLHISADKSFVIHPEFVNDFENEDYNNAFYNVTVIEEE